MAAYIFLLILGSVMILEALPLFISPLRMKEYYRRLSEGEPGTLRTIAFSMIIAGLIIVFLVKDKICG